MKRFIIKSALVFILLVSSLSPVWSQPWPPGGNDNGNGGAHGGSGNNAAAPIGTADILLISLAALYGARKLYLQRKLKEA